MSDRAGHPTDTQGPQRRQRGGAGKRLPVALWVYVLFASVYLLTSRGSIASQDARLRLEMARRLLAGQGMEKAEYRPKRKDKPHIMHWWLGHVLVLASTEPVAKAIHRAAPDWPDYQVSEAAACSVHALTSAVIPMLAALWALEAGYSLSAAVGGAAILGAATLLWKYSQDCYYEIHQGLFLLGAFYAALLAIKRSPLRYMAWAGASFGAAWLVKVTNLMHAPAIIVAWLAPYRRRGNGQNAKGLRAIGGPLLAFAMAFLPFWIAESVFDWWRYGMWPVPGDFRQELLPLNIAQVPRFFFDAVLGGRLGVLWYMPAFVGSFLFAGRMVKRLGIYGWAVLASLVANFVFAVIIHPLAPDFRSWGLRFFVPALPLCGLLFSEWVEWMRRASRAWRAACGVIIALSVGVQVLGTAVHNIRWHLDAELHQRAGLPQPATPILQQFSYVTEVFDNYLREEKFRLARKGDPLAVSRAQVVTFNYPNYWWALPVAFGWSKLPLLMAASALVVLAAVSGWRLWAIVRQSE